MSLTLGTGPQNRTETISDLESDELNHYPRPEYINTRQFNKVSSYEQKHMIIFNKNLLKLS